MRRPPGRARRLPFWVVVVVLLAVVLPYDAPAAGSGFPALPIADDGRFVTNLTAPTLSPGSSGILAFLLSNPLSAPLLSASVTVEAYAFNAYPGNATGPVPSGTPLTLTAGGTSSSSIVLSAPAIAAGADLPMTVTVTTASNSPSGTFALRFCLSFTENATAYLLRSRGYFSATSWANATTGPNGTSTLNLTRLGVSGVIPETAVLVVDSPLTLPLYVVLGAALVFAAAGGYYAWRRGPGSSSASVGGPAARRAERAFGKRRTSDGD